MKHNHMIEALPPNGTNHALHVGSLPRGARRGQHFANAPVSHLFPEGIAEDGIAVPQQVARELVKGKGLPQLLSRPFRARVGGHIGLFGASLRASLLSSPAAFHTLRCPLPAADISRVCPPRWKGEYVRTR